MTGRDGARRPLTHPAILIGLVAIGLVAIGWTPAVLHKAALRQWADVASPTAAALATAASNANHGRKSIPKAWPGLSSDAVLTPGQPEPAAPPGGFPMGCDGRSLTAPSADRLALALVDIAQQQGAQIQASWYEPADGVITVGDLTDLPAWSTSKVPLALAVLANRNGNGEDYRQTISAALRWSDNEAAATLWWALGADDQARAQAVTEVLRQTGDSTTVVPATQLFPPYSMFGQTQWTTTAQLGFALALPCLTGADQVIDDMAAVVGSQRWGLGKLPDSVLKGGWGPSPGGGYTVRQFGWYAGAEGTRVPMAIAVRASSFDAGVAVLNQIAAQLA